MTILKMLLAAAGSAMRSFWGPAINVDITASGTRYSLIAHSPAAGYVVVASDSSLYGVASFSRDAQSWSKLTYQGTATRLNWFSVAANPSGVFVSVGMSFTGQPLFSCSNDGVTWTTPAAIAGTTAKYAMYAVEWLASAGIFVAIGNDQSGGTTDGYPVYSTSTNGKTWTAISRLAGYNQRANFVPSVSATNGSRLVIAFTDSTGASRVSSTTNGTTWTTPTLFSNSSQPSTATDICYSAVISAFYAIGYDANNRPLWSYSVDGITWTQFDLAMTVTFCPYTIAAKGNDLVIVGVDQNKAVKYTVSKYGANWSALQDTPYTGAIQTALQDGSSGFTSGYGVYPPRSITNTSTGSVSAVITVPNACPIVITTI